jgi:hypothetical protein
MNTPDDATAAKLDAETLDSQPQRGDLTSAQGIALGRERDTAPDPPADDLRRANINLAISSACYLAFFVAVSLVRIDPRHLSLGMHVLAVFATTLVFMFLQLWVPWTVVQIRQSLKTTVLDIFMYLSLWGVVFFVINWVAPVRHMPNVVMVALTGTVSLCMTLALALFGLAVSFIVREAKILLPLGFIAGIIDIVGAMTPIGFTANTIRQNHQLVTHVSVPVPTVHGLPLATIGPGDVVFIAFFFAIVVRHHLNRRGTFWAMYGLLTLAMMAVRLGLVPAVAALAPMGIAVIFCNMRYFEFDRSEKFAMVYVAIIAIAAATLFFLYTSAHVFHHPRGG